MFPGVCQAPNLGNGGEWYGNAVRFGWPHDTKPVPGWLASFNVYPPYGDVGLITGINGDGTLQRYGVNWHLDGKWSSDKVPIEYLIGSFQPPGPFFGPRSQTQGQQQGPDATGARGLKCRFMWRTPGFSLGPVSNVGSQSICFDGLVGVLAIGAGLTIFGLAMVIAFRKPLERAGGRAAQVAGTVVEIGGVATAQPEAVAAGEAVRRGGRAVRERGERPPRRPRGLAYQGSVQERETYKDLRNSGYSPVESRRAAQAAGSQGDREERLRRALLSAGQ